VRRLRPELWRQKNWLLHHDIAPSHTTFFTRDFFYQKHHDCPPPPTYVSLFPRLKLKIKGCHFDTVDVVEAELQVVLNTLTEHDFQDSFKKMTETLVEAHTHGRGLLRGWWWPVGPQLVFDQVVSPVPDIIEDSLYSCTNLQKRDKTD
jgi:hypothetical protein